LCRAGKTNRFFIKDLLMYATSRGDNVGEVLRQDLNLVKSETFVT